jgi:hypothetical protein
LRTEQKQQEMSDTRKQTAIRLAPDNLEKLEAIKAKRGETYNTIINSIIRQHGQQIPSNEGGPAAFYTGFLSVLEAYLFTGVERGIMEQSTRQHAADFYEAIVKELAKHTKAKAIIDKMAVNN